MFECTFQVILLSATMPTDVLEVTKRFMRNPIRILVKKEELTLEGIKQFFILVEKEVGDDCLCLLSQTLALVVDMSVSTNFFNPFPTKDLYIHPSRCHPSNQGPI